MVSGDDLVNYGRLIDSLTTKGRAIIVAIDSFSFARDGISKKLLEAVGGVFRDGNYQW